MWAELVLSRVVRNSPLDHNTDGTPGPAEEGFTNNEDTTSVLTVAKVTDVEFFGVYPNVKND